MLIYAENEKPNVHKIFKKAKNIQAEQMQIQEKKKVNSKSNDFVKAKCKQTKQIVSYKLFFLSLTK